ncbi:cytidine deaminase-like protein [Parasitella parasitica]|nr:cytidine deaminase-like protein [Parasitella parasitica]
MLSCIFLINIFIAIISFVNGEISNPCQSLSEKQDLDECYMNLALDLGLQRNPRAPFGTIIVNHVENKISCVGVNENDKDILLHGETVAFKKYYTCYVRNLNILSFFFLIYSCTEMYPSPTNDDLKNPGLRWNDQTLYTTGEPCPMCAAQIMYRKVKRVVWATSTKDISKSGRMAQFTIDIHHIFNSMKVLNSTSIDPPVVEGGVLKEKCDHAFWCAFKEYRDEAYMKFMENTDNLDYVLELNGKFPCVTIPWHV